MQWWSKLFSDGPNPQRHTCRVGRLELEQLEERLALSGLSVLLAGGTEAISYGCPRAATYLVVVNRQFASGPVSVNLSLLGQLPSGTTATFESSTLNFSSVETSKTTLLSVSSGKFSPTGTTTFTVRAQNASDAADFATSNGTFTINPVAAITDRLSGFYVGTFTGTEVDDPATPGSTPQDVSGVASFAFSDSITVFSPGSGSGTITSAGALTFSGSGTIGGLDNVNYDFRGTMTKSSQGVPTVTEGTWTDTFTGGKGSGTWTAQAVYTLVVTVAGSSISGSAIGLDGAAVSGSYSYSYTDSQGNTSSTPPSTPGNYVVEVKFDSADSNYADAVSDEIPFTVSAATPVATQDVGTLIASSLAEEASATDDAGTDALDLTEVTAGSEATTQFPPADDQDAASQESGARDVVFANLGRSTGAVGEGAWVGDLPRGMIAASALANNILESDDSVDLVALLLRARSESSVLPPEPVPPPPSGSDQPTETEAVPAADTTWSSLLVRLLPLPMVVIAAGLGLRMWKQKTPTSPTGV